MSSEQGGQFIACDKFIAEGGSSYQAVHSKFIACDKFTACDKFIEQGDKFIACECDEFIEGDNFISRQFIESFPRYLPSYTQFPCNYTGPRECSLTVRIADNSYSS